MTSARRAQRELLTRTELAKRLGVNRQRIGQYVKAGLPVDQPTNRIDLAGAKRWVAENVALERRGKWKGYENRLDAGEETLNELRRRREALRCQREALELEKARDALIEREVVQRFVAGRAKLERDAWVAWASRCAVTISAELGVKTGDVFPLLEREVRDQLRQLAETPMGRLAE